jgi:hypothetical protein
MPHQRHERRRPRRTASDDHHPVTHGPMVPHTG